MDCKCDIKIQKVLWLHYTGICGTSQCIMCHIWPCMISKKFFQLQWKIKIIQFLVFEIFLYDSCMISRKSNMVLVWLPRIHTKHIWPSMITKNHIWPSTKSKKVVWSLTRDSPIVANLEKRSCDHFFYFESANVSLTLCKKQSVVPIFDTFFPVASFWRHLSYFFGQCGGGVQSWNWSEKSN